MHRDKKRGVLMNFDYETPWLLEQWWRWSHTDVGLCLGYPSSSFNAEMQGSTVPMPLITDDVAMVIGEAVARLMKRDAEMGNSVVMYYSCGQNVSSASRRLKMPRKRVDVLVKAGTAWIDGRLWDHRGQNNLAC